MNDSSVNLFFSFSLLDPFGAVDLVTNLMVLMYFWLLKKNTQVTQFESSDYQSMRLIREKIYHLFYSLMLLKNYCFSKVSKVIKYFLFLGLGYIKQEALGWSILHKILNFKIIWTKVGFNSHALSIFRQLKLLSSLKEVNIWKSHINVIYIIKFMLMFFNFEYVGYLPHCIILFLSKVLIWFLATSTGLPNHHRV